MTGDDAEEYCETLLHHFAGRLSEWEDGFVRSLQAEMRAGRTLTAKQTSVLDALMERCARRYEGREEDE